MCGPQRPRQPVPVPKIPAPTQGLRPGRIDGASRLSRRQRSHGILLRAPSEERPEPPPMDHPGRTTYRNHDLDQAHLPPAPQTNRSRALDTHRIRTDYEHTCHPGSVTRKCHLNVQQTQALRILVGARSQMTRSTTAAINTLTALVRTNDSGVDARCPLSKKQIRQISTWRTRRTDSLSQRIARTEAKRLATDITSLREESKDNLEDLDALTNAMSPALRATVGIGPVSAAQFLISWSHPGRIHSEAVFASLAGASPIPAPRVVTSVTVSTAVVTVSSIKPYTMWS